jgi:group I intron endonuclease
MNTGIYKIENIQNGKFYIGSAVNLEGRKRQHLSDLSLNKHSNRHLQFAWNKYGSENFKFDILETCEKDNLLAREQFYIDNLNACIAGYNLNPLSVSSLGIVHSEETRKKLSESHKGQRPWMWGKKHTEETKKKISLANTGKLATEEHKRKLSEARAGNKHPMYGKHHSEETKRKISLSEKGKIMSEEAKRKISEAFKGEHHPMYGKHHTYESKQKISKKLFGNIPWNKGKKLSDEHRYNLSIAHLKKNINEGGMALCQ